MVAGTDTRKKKRYSNRDDLVDSYRWIDYE
jgi:hypothetical protein